MLFDKFSQNDPKPLNAKFDGSDYVDSIDRRRLAGQILRVYECMKDSCWRTVNEIHEVTGDPHASISAQLRHLRKAKFGSYTVTKRPRGDRKSGLFEYQVLTQRKGTELCQQNPPCQVGQSQ